MFLFPPADERFLGEKDLHVLLQLQLQVGRHRVEKRPALPQWRACENELSWVFSQIQDRLHNGSRSHSLRPRHFACSGSTRTARADAGGVGDVLNSGWRCRGRYRAAESRLIRGCPVNIRARVYIHHTRDAGDSRWKAFCHAEREIWAGLLAIRHRGISGRAAIHRLHHAGHVNRHPAVGRRGQRRDDKCDDRQDHQQSRKE